jgi:DNA-binding MarR family transcriptional regulator
MDAYQSQIFDLAYSDEPPILLVASSDGATRAARRAIEAANYRVGATLTVEVARERIAMQPKASAVWLEIDRDDGALMEELVGQVARDVEDGRYAAVVSTTGPLIDRLFALLGNGDVELIADADGIERVTALATVTAQQQVALGVAEATSDRNSERLRQLSEEMSRIASTLARLSSGPVATSPIIDVRQSHDAAALSADVVRNVIRARRLRARYFPEELFADPAWDMLLDLLQAEIAQLRVPVSSLCIAAAVPATTALRWLKTLVSQGLFVRRADPHDGRRVFVELAPEASQALRRYFAEVGPAAVI